jgi:hypothetical protein
MCEMDAPSSDSRAAWGRPGWIFFYFDLFNYYFRNNQLNVFLKSDPFKSHQSVSRDL